MKSSSNPDVICSWSTAKVTIVMVMSAHNSDVTSSPIAKFHARGATQYHQGSALVDQLNDGYM